MLEQLHSILLDLAPWLLVGAFASGALAVLLPEGWMQRRLVGPWGVVKAVALGTPLPLCSCAVIPVALGMQRAGASQGATVAFLISTPQTGVDSVLVTWALLGWPIAVFKVGVALVLGLLGGWLTDAVTPRRLSLPVLGPAPGPLRPWPLRMLKHALEMLRSIWKWIALGVVVSAMISAWAPADLLGSARGASGIVAMLLTLAIAAPMYVCATASVPIAASLVAAGLPPGAALVFLIAGPATNVATIGAVHRALGVRPLAVYLGVTLLGSLAAGLLFQNLLPIVPSLTPHAHHHGGPAWWAAGCAALLVGLCCWFAVEDLRGWVGSPRRTEGLGPVKGSSGV